MSYYILPKINNKIVINPIYSNKEHLEPYISNSLLYYYNEIIGQIKQSSINIPETFNNYIKIINPYEFIYSKVPGSKFSVSKLKPNSNLFYDFLELSILLNIFEQYKHDAIKTLHLSYNKSDTIECIQMLRENYDDEVTCYDNVNDEIIKLIGEKKFNFLFFEVDKNYLNSYIVSLIEYLMIIFKNQEFGGTCVIKINDIFYKPVIDIIYILSSLYDKVYIFKPNTSNVTTFEKYIICKNYLVNDYKTTYLKLNYYKLFVFLKKLENNFVVSLLDYDIPCYFTIKLDDINITFGQYQLESLDILIGILKNKNKDDKLETIKKINIQKSVEWCEKYKIPCNKFLEKTNIFLPINKEAEELETEIEIEKLLNDD